jgi:hypothetical protein
MARTTEGACAWMTLEIDGRLLLFPRRRQDTSHAARRCEPHRGDAQLHRGALGMRRRACSAALLHRQAAARSQRARASGKAACAGIEREPSHLVPSRSAAPACQTTALEQRAAPRTACCKSDARSQRSMRSRCEGSARARWEQRARLHACAAACGRSACVPLFLCTCAAAEHSGRCMQLHVVPSCSAQAESSAAHERCDEEEAREGGEGAVLASVQAADGRGQLAPAGSAPDIHSASSLRAPSAAPHCPLLEAKCKRRRPNRRWGRGKLE